MTIQLVDAAPSLARLPADSGLRREIRTPQSAAPAAFLEAFDATTLVYDCFWHADGRRVLLVGPPPLNLKREWDAAIFRAMPSGARLAARFTTSLSQMVIGLDDVPAGTLSIALAFGGQSFEIAVGPNLSAAFAGRRVLFSMNKNNRLDWIRHWAAHHVATQGTDAVVLFDNASTLYGTGDIVETLASINGLKVIAIPSWPAPFGARDPRTAFEPYWSHFLQNCSMSVVLRRMGASAHSLLNLDIDELAWAGAGRSVHDLVKASRTGFVTFKGQWVEAIALPDAPPDHRAFSTVLADAKARLCPDNKWALDPSRPWTQALKRHPYWHWMGNRPLFSKEQRTDISYWHFKGINTNWKLQRTAATSYDPAIHVEDATLAGLAGAARLPGLESYD